MLKHVTTCYNMLQHLTTCYTMLYHVIPCYLTSAAEQCPKKWLDGLARGGVGVPGILGNPGQSMEVEPPTVHPGVARDRHVLLYMDVYPCLPNI